MPRASAFGDRRSGGVYIASMPTLLPAVVEGRQFGLAQHAERPARLFEAAMLGDV